MSQEIDKKTPLDRLTYSGSLEPVVIRLSDQYGIGTPNDFSIIGVGYEDCNVIIDSQKGKFVAKIFQKGRTQDEITRYISTMERVVAAGINHPPLIRTNNRDTVYNDSDTGLSMVLMDFIDGKTYLDLKRAPTPEERKSIIEQAAKINNLSYHPPYIFDSWAIPNIKEMFRKTKEFIDPNDLKLVEEVLRRYDQIPISTLPTCFVHGDFTKSNVLKGTDGKIYILDFSVANWYPRIQELAVIGANLLHDDSNVSITERSQVVAEEYGSINPLTPAEIENLPNYTLAGVAMEFMGSYQEKYLNGNDTEETEYWLNLGREGLRKELTK
ncbi:MAG TPA: phosphotransferase [Patescibacteria group bacterium]|nr:phosphotransferase [Patescibacteria group bacterium]